MKNLQNQIQQLLNLYKEKKLSEAESYNKKLLDQYPRVVILYNILGLILTDRKKTDEAIKCYEKGIEINPKYAMIYNNLGGIYRNKEDLTKAENYYKKSISLDNKISEPHNNLGNLYLFLNKYDDAIECYKKAVNISPKFAVFHYNLGVAYKNMGEIVSAKKYLEEATRLNKYFCIAHRNLGLINKYKKKDEHLFLLQKLYIDKKINDVQKTELAFALGKAYDDTKQYKKAFKYFNEGNSLRRRKINFSIQEEKKEFENIKKIFNKKLFDKFKNNGSFDKTPIFILGMPRSGTTLVEQILSNHRSVFGGDELDFLIDIKDKYFKNKSSTLLLENINTINEDKLKVIGQEYIDKIKRLSDNSERVTDKLPINFKWIGIIKLILPKAKIVHCVRNSKDNCLSIFKNYFVNPKLNFAYNLNEIIAFSNLYSDLMLHWKENIPNFIVDVVYEELVSDSNNQIKKLLKECDLKWDDSCVNFYKNKRPIKTASDVQVRQKIYQGSLNVWKNYEKDLIEPFKRLKY